MMRVKTSLPMRSVPSQWVAVGAPRRTSKLGAFKSWGEIAWSNQGDENVEDE